MADLMDDGSIAPVERVGEKLRAARLAAGLNLSDVAQTTRIPLRHLDAIEQSQFDSLPSFTYAAGFVRAYARAVGADEAELGNALRSELGRYNEFSHAASYDEVADPARIPPRWLAWTAAALLILFLGGYSLWRSALLDGDTTPPVAPPRPAPAKIATPTPAPALTGPVVLTAREDVWFRIYDRQDKVLFEGIKKKGESYSIPADADTPMIRTGRADQIDVTLGGKALAALGPANRTVKDVVLTAAALNARAADTKATEAGNVPPSASGLRAPAAPTPAVGVPVRPTDATGGAPQP